MTGLRKFSLKIFCFAFVTIAFCIAITWKSEARGTSSPEIYSTLTSDTIPLRKKQNFTDTTRTDTIPVINQNRLDTIVNIRDSLPRRMDSLPRQSVDTFSLKMSKDTLDAPVNYEA